MCWLKNSEVLQQPTSTFLTVKEGAHSGVEYTLGKLGTTRSTNLSLDLDCQWFSSQASRVLNMFQKVLCQCARVMLFGKVVLLPF